MQHIVTPIGTTFRALDARVRVIVIVVAALAVAAAAAMPFVFRTTDAELFAQPLGPAQLSEVAARLTAWDVPFRATADNVVVDPARRRALALRLATAGVPHKPVASSLDTLKTIGALTPQNVVDAQMREGLQGDLASGLRGIAGVLDASVLIAPATRGFFVDEPSHDASASVRVTLDQGKVLGPDTVAGMRSYVANAVPGLVPEHVSIVDQNGVALGAATGEGSEDRALESTLQTALDRTIGAGETLVIAHADTDPNASTVREIKRVPISGGSDPAVQEEHYRGKNKQYDKVRRSDDRGSDTIERKTETVAGRTNRRSIAVLVDQGRAAMIPRIRAVVAAGAGLDTRRGDSLVVQAVPFAHAPTPPPVVEAQPSRPQFAALLAPPVPQALAASALGGALIIGAFSLAGSRRAHRRPAIVARDEEQVIEVLHDADPAAVHASLAGEPPYAAAAVLSTLPSPTTAAVLEMYDADERREIVKRLAKPVSPIVRDVTARAANV